MKGKHNIVIESDKLKYEFSIKRNITVIQGDSASGKTTLVNLLNTYGRFGENSGIIIQSDVPCVVYSNEFFSWERYFTNLLTQATKGDSIRAYDKSKLKPYYYEGKNKDEILRVLPMEIRETLAADS